MAVEPKLPTTEPSQPASPSGASAPNGAPHGEESPELLRWRADLLLDEMMLGAVDISAGNLDAGNRPDSKRGLDYRNEGPPAPAGGGEAAARTAYGRPSNGPAYGATTTTGQAYDESRAGESQPNVAERPTYERTSWEQPAVRRTDEARRWMDTEPARPDVAPPHSAAPAYGAPANGRATPSEQTLRPPAAYAASRVAGAGPVGAGGEAGGLDSNARPSGVKGPKRSNLLPRQSSVDAQALVQELESMRAELAGVVPVRHEWTARCGHLLDKAAAILQTDPDRSAEVEYYMQQVRSILERARQTDRWSQLYRRRLHIYLIAWVAFAAVALTSAVLFREQLAGWAAAALGGGEGGFAARNAAMFLATAFAGALGGALGALASVVRRGQLRNGFFDRKYSLRGLMLPILGAVFGMALYCVFGVIYYFANFDPTTLLAIGLAPAALALLFGLVQEYIFGIQP